VRLQSGLQRACATDKNERGLFDEVLMVIQREQPIQVRLLEIIKILEKARRPAATDGSV